jgi:hypothetical protein
LVEGGRAFVMIAEEGWRQTVAGREASCGRCEGGPGTLCAMKLWVGHGINLRDGFDA